MGPGAAAGTASRRRLEPVYHAFILAGAGPGPALRFSCGFLRTVIQTKTRAARPARHADHVPAGGAAGAAAWQPVRAEHEGRAGSTWWQRRQRVLGMDPFLQGLGVGAWALSFLRPHTHTQTPGAGKHHANQTQRRTYTQPASRAHKHRRIARLPMHVCAYCERMCSMHECGCKHTATHTHPHTAHTC